MEPDWKSPDWEWGGKVHNWRNHVPVEVRAIWPTFTDHQKKALRDWAEELSDREHWE